MKRVAVDTNAAIDYIRADRTTPPHIHAAENILLPIPVVGELFGGAMPPSVPPTTSQVEDLLVHWPQFPELKLLNW